jgi:hypothetical protein
MLANRFSMRRSVGALLAIVCFSGCNSRAPGKNDSLSALSLAYHAPAVPALADTSSRHRVDPVAKANTKGGSQSAIPGPEVARTRSPGRTSDAAVQRPSDSDSSPEASITRPASAPPAIVAGSILMVRVSRAVCAPSAAVGMRIAGAIDATVGGRGDAVLAPGTAVNLVVTPPQGTDSGANPFGLALQSVSWNGKVVPASGTSTMIPFEQEARPISKSTVGKTAVIGSILGLIAGRSAKAAAIGAGVGAAAGVGVAAVTRGTGLCVPAGRTVMMQLSTDLLEP